MTTRITRGLMVAVGALAVAGAALVAAPAASANGTLSITPSTGDAETALAVTTTGGCASANATHYIIKLAGGSLTEEITMNGLQPLSAIGATGAQTTPMTIPVTRPQAGAAGCMPPTTRTSVPCTCCSVLPC